MVSYAVLKQQFSCLDLQPLSDWITGMNHKPIYLLFGSTTLEKKKLCKDGTFIPGQQGSQNQKQEVPKLKECESLDFVFVQ